MRGRYRHYKGQEYEVLCVARHSETLEEMVVYKALYGNHDIWVRPKAMFEELVTDEKAKSVARFSKIDERAS